MVVTSALAEGSSPLAGRRHHGPGRRTGVVRLIPARGETTALASGRSTCRRAHPRSRGDDVEHRIADVGKLGSSPLAGRRHGASPQERTRLRLIPARGETTRTSTRCSRPTRAHPRSRGDDDLAKLVGEPPWGSSPLAGRRHAVPGGVGAAPGLIPARGETTVRAGCTAGTGWAHPRSRGDDSGEPGCPWGRVGSSPLAGRRQRSEVRRGRAPGLIPARGETTLPGSRPTLQRSAHPRSRGDDRAASRTCSRSAGSSPLAGRRQAAVRHPDRRGGLIPARGETTPDAIAHARLNGAHPRSRGDDSMATCA